MTKSNPEEKRKKAISLPYNFVIHRCLMVLTVPTSTMSDQEFQNQFYNPAGQESGYDMSSLSSDQ